MFCWRYKQVNCSRFRLRVAHLPRDSWTFEASGFSPDGAGSSAAGGASDAGLGVGVTGGDSVVGVAGAQAGGW